MADVAERLAVEVLDAERTARRQLLGDHDTTIDVRFTFYPAPGHNAEGAGEEGRLEEVAGYYRRLQPRRLVITGAAGAGKTVLAMQLMLRLLDSRVAEDPVPVRLSLASWDTDLPVERWISRHLIDTYRVPPAAAEALVKARRVLPVLDGLDEMDPGTDPAFDSRARRAIQALNAYQQATGKAALVLTCRSQAVEALEDWGVWIHDAARVEVLPVDPDSVRNFLTDRVDEPARWTPVREALTDAPHGPLATALSTPWRLTLAVTVYDGRRSDGTYRRDLQPLLNPALETPEAVGEHLLGLFIPAATAQHPSPRGAVYNSDDVRAWLTELAGYLEQNAATDRQVGERQLSSTDIVLHELWPLAGPRLPRAVTAALLAFPCLGWPVVIWLLMIDDFPWWLTSSTTGFLSLYCAILVYFAWREFWPQPIHVNMGRLRTPSGGLLTSG